MDLFYPEVFTPAIVQKISKAYPKQMLSEPRIPNIGECPYNPSGKFYALLAILLAGISYVISQDEYFVISVSVVVLCIYYLLKHRFSVLIKRYENELLYASEYENLLNQYFKAAERMISIQDIASYRKKLLEKFSEEVKETRRINSKDKQYINSGVTERMFHKYLVECFGDCILTDRKLEVSYSEKFQQSFYPDFIYKDDTGLHINIEIDEPYVKSTRQPIHFIGKDDFRNEFFVRNGWVVIRFSEEQVARYPELCCKEIALIIFKISKKEYSVKDFHATLPRYKRWSQGEAAELSKQAHRKQYLTWL